MQVTIQKHTLTEEEITDLISSIKTAPDLAFVDRKNWKRYPNPYCVFADNEFAGVCCTSETERWVKIGPLVTLPKFQGKGLGKLLFNTVVTKQTKSLCVMSSCPILQHLTNAAGFTEVPNVFALPMEVRKLLIKQLMNYLSIPYLLEALRKKLFLKRGKVSVFTKLLL
ncbi:MAG: GNAT family N-acetyltransferase [Microgenomates group bacterium]